MNKLILFFQKPFFQDKRTLLGLWVLIAVISALTKLGVCNNYLIFKYTFWHLLEGTSLYDLYPEQYADSNHYGPVFGLLMTPFAILPDWLGMTLWRVALTVFLFWAVRQSRFSWKEQLFIFWFCAHELLTALFMSQFNIAIAAIVLLAYVYIEQGKDKWAAFFIILGTFVKLYGIVGLAFFFFSQNKKQLILWLCIWSAVLFCLPMLVAGPEYVIDQYKEWYLSLAGKNEHNLFSSHQNISLLGMIRKIGMGIHMGNLQEYVQFLYAEQPAKEPCFWTTYPDSWVILPGLALFGAPYLRLKQWKNEAFRRMFLASALMFICLFSTGTESSGYIIAILGTVIWYTAVPWQRGKAALALMVLIFVLTSLSPSDLFPAYLRYNWVWPFALKALPITLCWLWLCYEMLTRDYSKR